MCWQLGSHACPLPFEHGLEDRERVRLGVEADFSGRADAGWAARLTAALPDQVSRSAQQFIMQVVEPWAESDAAGDPIINEIWSRDR